jgi:mRNA interferase HigB
LKGTKDYSSVKSALDAWFHEVDKASWQSPADVKRAHTSASLIGNERVVFNVRGNAFRLVVAVDYPRQIVFVKWIGSHAEYDKIDVATVKYARKTHKN